MKKRNLGKKRAAGDWFVVTTRKQCREKKHFNDKKYAPLKVYRVGDKGIFEKGKRKYFCVVKRLVEVRTGLYIAALFPHEFTGNKRWWMFSYIVEIIEN